MDNSLRPFFFFVVFWGEKYRQNFLNLCVSSLLSKNNIPALEPNSGHRFLICTTGIEWEAMQGEPIFEQLACFIQPEWVEIEAPSPVDSKYAVMSSGHKLLTSRVFEARAYGAYISPDCIFSDGYCLELQRHARAGKRLVLQGMVRFEKEGVENELKELGLLKKDQPTTVPPRQLIGIGLRNLHSYTKTTNWDAPCFSDYPVYCYWDVPGEDGIVLYTHAWIPVLMDYGRMDNHDMSTFDDWTIDGDYLHKNFDALDMDIDLHIIVDSDELSVLSLTEKDEGQVVLNENWLKSWRMTSSLAKGNLIRDVYFSPAIDPFKKKIFQTPIRLHGEEFSEKWGEIETISQKILRQHIDFSYSSRFYKALSKFRLFCLWLFETKIVRYIYVYSRVIVLALRRDPVEIARILRRIRLIFSSKFFDPGS